MKTFLPFDTMAIHCDSGVRYDFPRLARESGFSFNLYRGRVDWNKIGAIDVDKMIRERDLETLQDTLHSVMSCSLDSEYDLKVLDPNFVKLFRLAQLAADFLLYCRNYLDHCVTVMQDQLRVALQEIEHLQKSKQQKSDEIISLHRKLKSISKSVSSGSVPTFKCLICRKVFVAEQYLLHHQEKRHPELSAADPSNSSQAREIDSLRQQVNHLQERLHATEEALKLNQTGMPDNLTLQAILQSELQKLRLDADSKQSPKLQPRSNDGSTLVSDQSKEPINEEVVRNLGGQSTPISLANTKENDQEPIPQSIEQLKVKHRTDQEALMVRIDLQSEEIKSLREQLQEQHQMQEVLMQRKLEDMQRQHQAKLDELRLSIIKSREPSSVLSTAAPVDVTMPGDPAQLSQTQAWLEQSEVSDSSEVNIPQERATFDSTKSNLAASPAPQSPSVFSTTFVSQQSKARSQTVVQKDYESPSEQESLELPTNAAAPPTTSVQNRLERTASFVQPSVEKGDKSNPPKSMYGKSSGSSDSTESESGSSSYESDSQTSNSEQGAPNAVSVTSETRSQLTPEIMSGLKEDLLGLMNRRLRELGVDPEWTELPSASFHSNMATVKHHENIVAKTQKSYFELQEDLKREVDKRVSDSLRPQQSSSSSSNQKGKKSPGSTSIFARLKSHVKSKLSPSGRPSILSKHTQSKAINMKTVNAVENDYSMEPSTSKVSNDYETVHEIPLPVGTEDAGTHGKSVSDNLMEASKSGTTVVSHETVPEKRDSLQGTGNNLKVYSRTMYPNLSKSDIEIEKKDLPSNLSVKPTSNLQTSTPMKTAIHSFPAANANGGRLPFLSSDVESISELDSDVNDVSPTTSEKPPSFHTTRPHTPRTTAELLASVEKLRNSGLMNSSQTIVKSNLKSSLSTGNIMKKKVVFQDEKDGFDTIELGPAHSSFESITPHRSHSENSLATALSSSQSSDRPVPQPRISLTPLAASVSANKSYSSDSDWDKDSSDAATLKSSDPQTSRHSFGEPKDLSPKHKSLNSSSRDVSHVSDIVKDIEKKLQEFKGSPTLGTKFSATSHNSLHSTSISLVTSHPRSSNGKSFGQEPSVSRFGYNNSDNLSDLLIDDFSSS